MGTAVTGSCWEPQPQRGGALAAVLPPTASLCGGRLTPHTCLICLKLSGCRLERMLHSGCARIWKATAQWWFSRGDMSLYRMASSVRALIWYLDGGRRGASGAQARGPNAEVYGLPAGAGGQVAVGLVK